MEEKKAEMIDEEASKAVNGLADQDAENAAGGGHKYSTLVCPKCGSWDCYSVFKQCYCNHCGYHWIK